jgi:hypothetical protein
MRGDIPLAISIDDRPGEANCTYSWAGGGAVHTLSSVLPERGLAVELISTYVGHADTPTIVTHLMLGPVGHAATIRTEAHAHEHLDPVEGARECAYDHAQQLIELFTATGHPIKVQLDEQSFTSLERIQ